MHRRLADAKVRAEQDMLASIHRCSCLPASLPPALDCNHANGLSAQVLAYESTRDLSRSWIVVDMDA
jgi:hypothetical protein